MERKTAEEIWSDCICQKGTNSKFAALQAMSLYAEQEKELEIAARRKAEQQAKDARLVIYTLLRSFKTADMTPQQQKQWDKADKFSKDNFDVSEVLR